MGDEAEVPRLISSQTFLGGWSKDLNATLQKLVGNRAKDVLRKMQRACLSGTLNVAHTFKVGT